MAMSDENVLKNWVAAREQQLFEVDNFTALGKQNDSTFQALAFIGKGSQQLALASTVLSANPALPVKINSELKYIQQQLYELLINIREINS